MRIFFICLLLLLGRYSAFAQKQGQLTYQLETSGVAGKGSNAPLWFTANRHGLMSNEHQQTMLCAGLLYQQPLKHHWKVSAAIEMAGGCQLISDFWLQQAYLAVNWKKFLITLGSKESQGAPLERNAALTSGWMVEGPNARPIPQLRLELTDYLPIYGTRNWLSVKGHFAYGYFLDGSWQKNFVHPGNSFVQDVWYHSKSLMFRIGNREHFPVEFELGLIDAAQFGGKRYIKQTDGSSVLERDFGSGIKNFFKVILPKQGTTLENVAGNHCGSWNFALTAYCGAWKIQTYLEHFFEDHSQMFWEYGRWKDGLLGIHLIPVKNKWLTSILWEGMSTKDQTKSVLYDGVGGSFPDLQMSGNDHYYNNYEYLAWQSYGATLGHPFLYGPQYNTDGSNEIKSTRVRSNHLGLTGDPSVRWNWRLLASFARHWGTYRNPLDKQRKQFSGLAEVTYKSQRAKGWSASVALGLDRGNYLGNNVGGMLTLRKIGKIKL